MLGFLKQFGLGMVYILCSPLVLVFLCLWALYNLILFVIELIRALKSFFKGQSFFAEFPEDIEAKKILSIEAINGMQNQAISLGSPTITIENASFNIPQTNLNVNDNRPTLSRPTLDDEANKK